MAKALTHTVRLPGAGGPARCAVRFQRSPRARHVSLRIDARAGHVVVTLPPRAPRRAGLALIGDEASWVRARLAALAPPVRFAAGARIPVGGTPHVLRRARGHGPVALEPGAIHVPGPAAELPGRVAAFLREEAARRIRPIAERHAATLGVAPRALRVKDQRTRWGSCGIDGTLSFSWRLVMAPDWVLDYAVAHEVAHLAEMNHSPRFWAQVARLSPHRVAAMNWLRLHGPGLLRVG